MSTTSAPIGYVARHGSTVAHQIGDTSATFVYDNPDEIKRRVGTYRDGFEIDGPANLVMCGPSDRCIGTALMVAGALVPYFDVRQRIALLRQRAEEFMERFPHQAYHDWFWRGVQEGECNLDEVLGNFPAGSPLERIVVSKDFDILSTPTRRSFPADKTWALVTHANVVALVRNRKPHEIRLWDMHPVERFPDAIPS